MVTGKLWIRYQDRVFSTITNYVPRAGETIAVAPTEIGDTESRGEVVLLVQQVHWRTGSGVMEPEIHVT